jgi:ppGpp synthetase/RelA/SpoT-type nucleotidyltranferase
LNTVIDTFVAGYVREFDYYQETARISARLCEQALRDGGMRVIVTSRAKDPERLGEKLRLREKEEGKNYQSDQDIYNDVIDLSGVRIALYFPADAAEVDQVIQSSFKLLRQPKKFPDERRHKYDKQFDGYHATHYLVGLKAEKLGQDQKRYLDASVEIQVASVLMHAWAEVEHDLVYKPLSGALSESEYAILDELNGLVLTGEVALRRLQSAFDERVNKANAAFTNHYELAAFLHRELKLKGDGKSADMGRADWLFQLLSSQGKGKPSVIRPLLSFVTTEPEESRSIADQLIDAFIGKNKDRYAAFESIRTGDVRGAVLFAALDPETERAIGAFLSAWISLERAIRRRTQQKAGPWWLSVRQIPELSAPLREEIDSLRRLRNALVHGIAVPSVEDLTEATSRLKNVVRQLSDILLPSKRERKIPRKTITP